MAFVTDAEGGTSPLRVTHVMILKTGFGLLQLNFLLQ
jgi:hypothetical protein